MNIIIKATNTELTSAIEDYIHRRMQSITKFIKVSNPILHIEVGKSTNHHRHGEIFFAEGETTILGKKYFARAEAENLYTAIDELQAELSKEFSSKKGKNRTLFIRGSQKIKHLMTGIPFIGKRFR
ncbi:MAG: ribosome-associated translation inhibitor RaiA [bacterium]